MLDEPSSGLAPLVIDRILSVASQLCQTGMAVVRVTQGLVDQLLD